MSLSTSRGANPNYLAKVISIQNLRAHPNADRLQISTIDGNNVITGLTAKEGALYVYFPLESTLNKEYLSYSNSFSDSELNADKSVKGYFASSGRVRATRLRGEKSEGYIVPASDFSNWLKESTGADFRISDSDIGTEFDTICGVRLCEKYINHEALRKIKVKANKKDKKVKNFNRVLETQFHFHIDTPSLKKFANAVGPDDVIHITKKLHGTSVILSNVLCKRKLNWVDKSLKRLGVRVVEEEYDILYSSRKVIKNGLLNPQNAQVQHYYSSDIWGDCAKKYGEFLREGVTLYGEIVGFTKEGSAIQKDYDYGCEPCKFEFYAYRGTLTLPRGDVYEMSVKELETYCQRYGIKTVPELFYGTALEFIQEMVSDYDEFFDKSHHFSENLLLALSEKFLEKDCDMCTKKVPNEGVCVRIDKPFSLDVYKLKSFKFLERETKMLDKGEVDLETMESSLEEDA